MAAPDAKEQFINAQFGFSGLTEDVDLPLSQVSAAWSIEKTEDFSITKIKAVDGREMTARTSMDEMFNMFERAGIKTIDGVTTHNENKNMYLLVLEHTRLYGKTDENDAVIAAEGFPQKGVGGMFFYVLDDRSDALVSVDRYNAMKAGQGASPAPDAPSSEHS